jgi:DNA repair exonuclease SbcCD ATPase subunit
MDFNTQLLQLKTKKDTLAAEIAKKRAMVVSESNKHINHTKARFVLVEVSRQTQERLKTVIEQLVNLCLNEVFPDRNFNFKADFQIKRNKMECEFLVEVDGHEYSPKDDMGGSILDIISFALRTILWSFENPRSRNVIIMDEPFRFSGRLITKAVQMVKELSDKLGIQFIINTHSEELIDIADRSWHVTNIKGKSMVKQL